MRKMPEGRQDRSGYLVRSYILTDAMRKRENRNRLSLFSGHGFDPRIRALRVTATAQNTYWHEDVVRPEVNQQQRLRNPQLP